MPTASAHLPAARKYLADHGVPLDGPIVDIIDACDEYLDTVYDTRDAAGVGFDLDELADEIGCMLADALAPALVGRC